MEFVFCNLNVGAQVHRPITMNILPDGKVRVRRVRQKNSAERRYPQISDELYDQVKAEYLLIIYEFLEINPYPIQPHSFVFIHEGQHLWFAWNGQTQSWVCGKDFKLELAELGRKMAIDLEYQWHIDWVNENDVWKLKLDKRFYEYDPTPQKLKMYLNHDVYHSAEFTMGEDCWVHAEIIIAPPTHYTYEDGAIVCITVDKTNWFYMRDRFGKWRHQLPKTVAFAASKLEEETGIEYKHPLWYTL